jgi:hypothetical protein
MLIKVCRHCKVEFDSDDPRKKKMRAYIDECIDCVEERGPSGPPKYLAVAAGNGKMSDITILKFEDDSSREAYHEMWQTNTGYYKGKSCQLGRGLVSTSGFNFDVVGEFRGNENHKGKA